MRLSHRHLELTRSIKLSSCSLHTQTLLRTLNEVKASSHNIDVSLTESNEVKAKLMQEYEVYKKVCFKMASMYIGIDKIYSLSVTVFTSLYVKSMQSHKVMSYIAERGSYCYYLQ